MQRRCASCRGDAALRCRCGTPYCNIECQRANWSVHRLACVPVRDSGETALVGAPADAGERRAAVERLRNTLTAELASLGALGAGESARGVADRMRTAIASAEALFSRGTSAPLQVYKANSVYTNFIAQLESLGPKHTFRAVATADELEKAPLLIVVIRADTRLQVIAEAETTTIKPAMNDANDVVIIANDMSHSFKGSYAETKPATIQVYGKERPLFMFGSPTTIGVFEADFKRASWREHNEREARRLDAFLTAHGV